MSMVPLHRMSWHPTGTFRAPAPETIWAAVALTGLVVLGWWALIGQSASLGLGTPDLFAALCTPFGLTDDTGTGSRYALRVTMWIAMVLAMMLPSAATMVLTFAERASREHQRALGAVLALILGYCGVWVLISLIAAGAQLALGEALSRAALPERATGIFAGAALGFAGIYQFTTLKLASLASCRHPFSTRSELPHTALGGLRLGLEQGVFCVGCCAAMMGIMLAAGAMNLFWMLGFAAIMIVEKAVVSNTLPKLVGLGLLVAGSGLAISNVGLGPVLNWLGAR